MRIYASNLPLEKRNLVKIVIWVPKFYFCCAISELNECVNVDHNEKVCSSVAHVLKRSCNGNSNLNDKINLFRDLD